MATIKRKLLFLCCMSQFGYTDGFVLNDYSESPLGYLRSTTAPEEQIIKEESNFWFSRVRKRPRNDSKVPLVPNLDADGILPSECYRTLGKSENDPRQTCLTIVRFDELVDSSSNDLVSTMQQYIDAGLTTFQGPSLTVYRSLIQETPKSVLEKCNLVVPLDVPTPMPCSAASTRSMILDILHTIGAEALDTVQMNYNEGSPYHLDIMDVLTELQRDGLVRSVSGRNICPSLMREVDMCGFELVGNQIPVNLLNPLQSYSTELLMACQDTKTPLIMENALAGGLLTDRHTNQPAEPYMFQFTQREKQNVHSLHLWAARGSGNPWQRFQTDMLETLENIALKHRVSIATVALRWALQLEQATGVLVGFEPEKENLKEQVQATRQIFELELDEEDMQLLWEASGCEKPPSELLPFNLEDLEGMEESGDGLFLPNSAKLWI